MISGNCPTRRAHDLVALEGLWDLDVEHDLQGLFLRFDAVHTLANWSYI